MSIEAANTPTEPIDMRTLLHDRRAIATAVSGPRADPRQWHRRGLLAPAELEAIVAARVNDVQAVIPVARVTGDDGITVTDPTYGDFLSEPTA